jgi:phosphatidylglycerol:prolipoprotein diacylglycerol transferase
MLYRISKWQPRRDGFYFGLMLTLLFSLRFVIEFYKEYQSPFEADMWLNMGQVLSIPFILMGLIIIYRKRNECC